MTSRVSDQETGSNQDVRKKGKKEKKEANQSDGKQLLSEEAEEEEVSEQQPGYTNS